MSIESIQHIFQVFTLLSLSVFSSKPLKKLFIIVANYFLFETKFPFVYLCLNLEIIFFWFTQQQVHTKIPLFSIICQLSSVGFLLKLFFNLDLCIIAFLSVLVMKGLLLNRMIFFFIAA